MSTIKEKILEYAKSQSFPLESFFLELGVSYGAFKGENLKSGLNSLVVERLLTTHTDINPDWLLTGTGPMLRSAASITAGGDVLQQTGDVVIGKGNIIGADAQQLQGLQEQIARQEREIEELRRDKELLRAVVSGMMGQKQ